MTTKNFKSVKAFKKAMAFTHIHLHKGPSKHPFQVKIKGKVHKVKH